MRRTLAAAVAALTPLAALPLAAAAAPQLFDLDPEQTFVQFEVRHFGASTLRGRIGPIRGEVMLDAEAGRGRLGLVIDLRTLDTGLKLLDARLRQADLLDVAGQPAAYFVAERFRFEQGRPVEVTGEFTLRGTGVALTLRALRFACLNDAIDAINASATGDAGRRRCGGDFEGEVSRSAFGASFGVPLVADRVRLRVQVEALQRPQPR
ncbi:MAG: YceI family protein [Proteobacteria bacterium]|nr:YceI family protein [Pseudomonadota bacterium]